MSEPHNSKSGPLTLEALRWTQQCCGWLLEIAEASEHPDARAAARWLDAMGSRAYEKSAGLATDTAALLEGGTFPRPRH